MAKKRDFSKYVGRASGEADAQEVYKDLYKVGKGDPNKIYLNVKKLKKPKVKEIQLKLFKTGGFTVTNRYSDIMLPEKKKTTRIT